jgi:hypothetical protein
MIWEFLDKVSEKPVHFAVLLKRETILDFGGITAMTHRCWAALLMVTMLGACSQALSQNLVSPKLLPPPSALRAGIAARNPAFDMADDPSNPKPAAAPHWHWSKTGKILTVVGGGLIGAGAAAIVHGQNTRVACSGTTCVDVAWRATGAIWTGAGAALVIVGLTRHTTD